MSFAELSIVGPTASGKTALAVAIARRRDDIELVSVDAFAVYRGLDVGTAKPTNAERNGLYWHLIDLVDPSEEFSVAAFQGALAEARVSMRSRSHRAIYVGGTGLYHRAVVDGLEIAGRFETIAAELGEKAATPDGLRELYRELETRDPVGARKIEASNARRVIRALEVTLGTGRPFSSFGSGMDVYPPSDIKTIGLRVARDALVRRITDRLDRQLADGFLEEVRHLMCSPTAISRTAMQALGYQELMEVCQGTVSIDDARQRIIARTKRFAKRQEAWFRRDPRIVWVDVDDPHCIDSVDELLERASGRGHK